MKKILSLVLIALVLYSCSPDNVYSYVVQNDTDATIKVVFVNPGNNGIGEISPRWTTVIPAGGDAYCYEHIADPENIVDGKMQDLTTFKYIQDIEVYSGDKKAKVNYLDYENGFHNLNGTFSNHGAYTIIVEESDF